MFNSLPGIKNLADLVARDPRYQMGMSNMQAGSSTAPVYGPYDGLARVLQGVTGGFMAKKAMADYKARDTAAGAAMQSPAQRMLNEPVASQVASALAPAQAPNPPPMGGMSPMQQGGMGAPAPNFTKPPVAPGPSQTPMTPGTVGSGTSNGLLNQGIVNWLQQRGYTPAQARGIAAGISAESDNNPAAFNSAGGGKGAFGIGQWRGARQQELFRRYGPNPNMDQQLQFLDYELKGGDAGGQHVLAQKDELGTLQAYVQHFMRPGEAGGRGDMQRGAQALGFNLKDLKAPPVDNGTGVFKPGTVTPTGPAPQFNAPESMPIPGDPQRPADIPAAQSGLLHWGLQMLATGNTDLYDKGMELVDQGLQEKFTAEREAIARAYGLDTAKYTSDLNARNTALESERNAINAQRLSAQNANQTVQSEGYIHGIDAQAAMDRTNVTEAGANFRNAASIAGENKRTADTLAVQERMNTADNTTRLDAVREQALARQSAIWSQPGMAKIYDAKLADSQKWSSMKDDMTAFKALSQAVRTGSVMDQNDTALGVTGRRNKYQGQMLAIVNRLAPQMHVTGTGSSSDRDVEIFKGSLPNPKNINSVNDAVADKWGVMADRNMDYNNSYIQAITNGDQANFAKNWTAYINAVHLYDPKTGAANPYISFSDWLNRKQFDPRTGGVR